MADRGKKIIPLSLSGWRTVSKSKPTKTVEQSSSSNAKEFVLPTQNRFEILDDSKHESDDDETPRDKGNESSSDDERVQDKKCCRQWKMKCLKLEQENKELKKQQHEQKLAWKSKNVKLLQEIDALKKHIAISTAAQSFNDPNSPPPVQNAGSFEGDNSSFFILIAFFNIFNLLVFFHFMKVHP